MKKKVFSILGAAIVAGVVAFNVSVGSHGDSLSDLALANVEALAQNESGGADCSDGHARLCCRIWNVTYTGGNPAATCTTGGSWKCYYCIDY
jgi:hypothetical protein